MADEIDLMPFCGKDVGRENLHKPFTIDDRTYATDGHVIISVPKRDDVAAASDPPNVARVFKDAGKPELSPLRAVAIPTLGTEMCEHCSGRGTEHDCPNCRCTCEFCDGEGERIEKLSIGIRGAILDYKYFKLIATLPTLRLPEIISNNMAPVYFQFAGGYGAFMCRRSKFSKHVDEAPE